MWIYFCKLLRFCSKGFLVFFFAILLGDWYSVVAFAEEELSSMKAQKQPTEVVGQSTIFTKENLLFVAIWGGVTVVVIVIIYIVWKNTPPEDGGGGTVDWWSASTEHFLAGGDLKDFGRREPDPCSSSSDDEWSTELEYPLPGDLPSPKNFPSQDGPSMNSTPENLG